MKKFRFPAGLFAVALLSISYSCSGARRFDPLPKIGIVPDFQLTERSGEHIRRADLQGAPWVANFIFTSCAGPCPRISSQMAGLQPAVANLEDVRFVSFSVDPETDTPAVLREYANSFGASPERWLFLTGDKQQLYSLVHDGFKLAVDDGQTGTPDRPPSGVITHSTRFVLVDAEARIRGYYDSTELGFERKILDGLAFLASDQKN